MFCEVGLDSVHVEPTTLVVRDPAAVDSVMGLRTWANSAHRAGLLDADDITRWEEMYEAVR